MSQVKFSQLLKFESNNHSPPTDELDWTRAKFGFRKKNNVDNHVDDTKQKFFGGNHVKHISLI